MFSNLANVAYKEVVRCQLNIFSVLSGNVGKSFCHQIVTSFQGIWRNKPNGIDTVDGCNGATCATSSKTSSKSQTKDNISCLEIRLVRTPARRQDHPAKTPSPSQLMMKPFLSFLSRKKSRNGLLSSILFQKLL